MRRRADEGPSRSNPAESQMMIWCCPRCRGQLVAETANLRCTTCSHRYELIGDIPDLRVPHDAWIDFEEDLVLAREINAASHLSLEALIRLVYSKRPGWDYDRIELRTRQVMQAPARLERDISSWLQPPREAGDLILDLGCGAGMLLAAANRQGWRGVGVDVFMTWLVVADRLIKEWGGEPILAAALGESLPLHDGAIATVVSLDVIEHVSAPDQFLAEVERVTRTDGQIILTTPNRFSLTAEPHVQVWGVGWLPRPLQAPFVKWRSGKSYTDTRLMSSFGLRRRIQRSTTLKFRVETPSVPEEEIAYFRPMKAWLARAYNRVRTAAIVRPALLLFAPFFRIVARR